MNRKKTRNKVDKTIVAISSAMAMATMLIVSELDNQETAYELDRAEQKVLEVRESYENLSLRLKTVTHQKILLEKLKKEELAESQKKINNYKLAILEVNKELEEKESKIVSLQKELSALKKNKVASSYVDSNEEKSSATEKESGYNGWSKMTVEATGYSLYSDELGGNGDGVTATGTVPTAGRTIAVDPSVIPYGTEVYIPELGGTYIAEDTGGMINGNKIDIYMSHGDIARQWGRKSIEIYVNL